MEKITKTTKVIIQWFEFMPDGKPVIQTRKYNDINKAGAFIDKLPERGITDCTKKITETVHFENEITDGQLKMEV